MNELYLNRDIFGNTIPENAEEIIAALNLEIREFITKKGLNPEENDGDFDAVEHYAAHIADFYTCYGMTPNQVIERDLTEIKTMKVRQVISISGWVEGSGWSYSDSYDCEDIIEITPADLDSEMDFSWWEVDDITEEEAKEAYDEEDTQIIVEYFPVDIDFDEISLDDAEPLARWEKWESEIYWESREES